MAAPKTVFDVRRSANKPLSAIESRVLDLCKKAAAAGEPITQEIIREEIGSINFTGSTSAHILNRLEDSGHISRTFYQRGVQVCIASTGKCTAAPRNTAPHWRHREPTPAPAIQAVRERSKPISSMIEAEARMSGKSIAEFLADLVYIGWHEYQQETGL